MGQAKGDYPVDEGVRKDAWILTFTGRHVNLLDFHESDVDIEDIAHGLACCNRFAGHCRVPISVAQHSVYVSRLCANENAMQGLLHDASEAYLGDVTKWLKQTSPFETYRNVEETVQGVIYRRYGCLPIMTKQVAALDKLMLRFEGRQAFGLRRWERWTDKINYPDLNAEERAAIGKWAPWSWRIAEDAFHTQFRLLS